jgi:hypothetical protein
MRYMQSAAGFRKQERSAHGDRTERGYAMLVKRQDSRPMEHRPVGVRQLDASHQRF